MSKHTHKLKRVVLGKNKKDGYEVYRCMMTNCTSYFTPAMTVGLISTCWSCLKPFEFRGSNLRQVKPKCMACTGTGFKKQESVVKAADELMARLRGVKL